MLLFNKYQPAWGNIVALGVATYWKVKFLTLLIAVKRLLAVLAVLAGIVFPLNPKTLAEAVISILVKSKSVFCQLGVKLTIWPSVPVWKRKANLLLLGTPDWEI